VRTLTKSRKKFIPVYHQDTNLIKVIVQGGGRVPDILKGLYTSGTNAEKAIKSYMGDLENGQSGNKSPKA